MIKRLIQSLFLAASLAALSLPHAAAQTELKVGSTPTGVPFTFLNTRTNEVQGVMVDVITEIGKDAGFKVKVEAMPFASLIAALTSKKIDIISAAMYATEARKQVIDFSNTVYSYGEGLVVAKADGKDYKAFADLKDEVVGAQVGTAYVEPLKKAGVFRDVKVYDSIADFIKDIEVGRLKAGFGDYPIIAYQLSQGNFPGTRLAKSYKSVIVGNIGIGVRKEDKPVLDKINASLAKLQADGTVKKILAKWGLE
jgi:polar amino acid transport system substrate-binding protein